MSVPISDIAILDIAILDIAILWKEVSRISAMTFTQPQKMDQVQQTLTKVTGPRLTWSNKATLPTMYDLPSEDPEEPGLPDEFHDYQPALLSETFRLKDYASEEIFSAADLNLYYDSDNNWYKRPDWFGVLGQPAGCDSNEMRRSYVIWQEELSPFVVVELVSPGTEDEDFGRTVDMVGKAPTKWTVYEKILQIPYYIIYNRYDNTLHGFRWREGHYQPIDIDTEATNPTSQNNRKIWMPEINAGLGVWNGKYKRFTREWLRWYDTSGWILTPEEAERAKNKVLEQKLKALGVSLEDLDLS